MLGKTKKSEAQWMGWGILNVIPGAYYAGQSELAWHEGRYAYSMTRYMQPRSRTPSGQSGGCRDGGSYVFSRQCRLVVSSGPWVRGFLRRS